MSEVRTDALSERYAESLQELVAAQGGDFAAVCESLDGVLELADVVDLLDDLADDFIEILYHGHEVGFLGGFVFRLLIGSVGAGLVADGIGSWDKGVVDEHGWVVDEEGGVFVPLDEVA